MFQRNPRRKILCFHDVTSFQNPNKHDIYMFSWFMCKVWKLWTQVGHRLAIKHCRLRFMSWKMLSWCKLRLLWPDNKIPYLFYVFFTKFSSKTCNVPLRVQINKVRLYHTDELKFSSFPQCFIERVANMFWKLSTEFRYYYALNSVHKEKRKQFA